MKVRTITALLMGAGLALACGNGSGPANGPVKFEPPSTEFALRLAIQPPVNADQAMAIAAEAAGGTAIDVTEEIEKGELLFEVRVDTPSGRMEVEVRASDGAVVEIEPDDGSS